MRQSKSLLLLTGLLVLSPAMSGQASRAESRGQQSRLDFKIGLQLDEVHRQWHTLQQDSAVEEETERFRSISKRLQALDHLYLAVQAGSPIRTEAQLHAHLANLRAKLLHISRDHGLATDVAPRAPAQGTFSGRITGSDAPGGIEGVFVDVFDSGGDWVAAATTVADGGYITPGLSSGNYYARSNVLTGYINELYDDIPCYFICNVVTEGQKITVSAGSNTPDIDFDLEVGNTISGTITDAAVAPPNNAIEFVTVDFFDEHGQWVTNPSTDSAGQYVTPGMPDGTYYASTFNLDQYMNERYDDQQCVGRCDPIAGTPIVIIPGQNTVGVDFDLVKGGSIAGKVTADPSGVALENVVVEIYESNGDWRGTGWTDVTGNYITGGGLQASATYRALTFAPAPYLNELYNNVACYTGCDISSGTSIVVNPGAETSGKNFALPTGGTFSGTVTDGGSGLVGVGVEIFDTAGDWLNIVFSDGVGDYTSPGLPAGNYYARTWNDQGLINKLFDDTPCFFCDVTTGTPIAVTGGGADKPGIDFVLETGGTISGTVTGSDTGDELEAVIVDIFDSTGTWISNPSTDQLGHYTSPGLFAGDYYARTWNTDGYVNELYDDQPCPPTCDPVTSGSVIEVQASAETGGIDFVLDKGSAISGTIMDVDSTQPIAGMTVEIWDINGDFATGVASGADGRYETTGLSPGTYFATTWNDLGYPAALYDNYSCQGCLATLGTPIILAAGAPAAGVDFNLRAGGFITGRVTDTGSGLGIGDIHVEIWSVANQLVSWIATAADGRYVTTWSVPAGTYYVKTWNDQGYINEIYPNLPCAACDPNEGAAVVIDAGGTTTGINFRLAVGGTISGTLTLADPNDVTLTNIQIFDDLGQWVWSQRPPTTTGEYRIGVGLPTGTYYARTAGGRPYVNEVWNNQPCLTNCDVVVDGHPIHVTAPNTTAGIDFDLAPGVKLSGTVKDASSQTAIDDSIAEIFNPAGERVAGCRVGANGAFTCRQAIPAGTYYAATANYAGYIDEVYANPRISCVGGGSFCDVTRGAPIDVDPAVLPDEIHFTLDRGGWFEGSVIDELGRRGLAGTGILVYDNLGNLATSILWRQPLSQVPGGTYSSCGLPAGNYYAVTDTSLIGGYHADELYDDHLCVLACSILSGTPIGVINGSGTQDIDFELVGLVFGDGFESGNTDGWTMTQ